MRALQHGGSFNETKFSTPVNPPAYCNPNSPNKEKNSTPTQQHYPQKCTQTTPQTQITTSTWLPSCSCVLLPHLGLPGTLVAAAGPCKFNAAPTEYSFSLQFGYRNVHVSNALLVTIAKRMGLVCTSTVQEPAGCRFSYLLICHAWQSGFFVRF
jgi:hypothetical protein